jgi:alpha-amylase
MGKNHFYEDDEKNRAILNKVSDKCYLPANALMLDLIKRFKGRFRISFSISGVALEQMATYRPDVLQSFQELSRTGCVEFLSETYFHSLAFVFSPKEFKRQVELHRDVIKKYFGVIPVVFRNTELIYNNALAQVAERMGFTGVLCEGVDRLLAGRSPNFVYRARGARKIRLLLKNYRLSDDIAFRFSDRNWSEWPLHADTYASWIHKIAGNGDTINLFMDYETFGEHQWASTGIFDFMKYLPGEILKHQDFSFKTPSETLKAYKARDVYDVPEFTSWADAERDLSAWLSNPMEKEAARRLYAFEKAVMATDNPDLIHTWGKLQTSDHFYYMCTKYWSDGDVHKYFSPYDSPYDAYIYYMNVLNDFEITLKRSRLKPDKKRQKKPTAAGTA